MEIHNQQNVNCPLVSSACGFLECTGGGWMFWCKDSINSASDNNCRSTKYNMIVTMFWKLREHREFSSHPRSQPPGSSERNLPGGSMGDLVLATKNKAGQTFGLRMAFGFSHCRWDVGIADSDSWVGTGRPEATGRRREPLPQQHKARMLPKALLSNRHHLPGSPSFVLFAWQQRAMCGFKSILIFQF